MITVDHVHFGRPHIFVIDRILGDSHKYIVNKLYINLLSMRILIYSVTNDNILP